jgi:hypothetical protein
MLIHALQAHHDEQIKIAVSMKRQSTINYQYATAMSHKYSPINKLRQEMIHSLEMKK